MRQKRNIPEKVAKAILASAMTFSTVAAGITPLCAPVVAYAGEINTESGVTINSDQNIEENTGNSVINNGYIDDNQGDVDENNGTISVNYGNVDNNSSTGTIGTNASDVVENNGTIVNNASGATVTDNFGEIRTNNGTVINNYGGTVGNGPGGSVENQFHSVGVSGDNINKSYGDGFTDANGNKYLLHNQSESYVTLTAASGYELSGTVTSGDEPVTGSGYLYRIFRESGNSNAFVLEIRTPTGNLNIDLSALGIISQLIGGPTTPTTPTTPTSSEVSVSDSSGESGLSAVWTVGSNRIYRLIMQSLRERQANSTQKGSYNIYVGDNPSFDEKAVRALVDKSEHVSWVVFTLNGKAYEILIPSNITPEQREVLINLLKQEPNGDAGPLRLVQLMNQVGIVANVMEMTGRDLVAEFTKN